MTKINKMTVRILSASLVASLFAGFATIDVRSGYAESGKSVSAPAGIERTLSSADVNKLDGLVDTSGISKYFDQSAIYKLPEGTDESDEISVIVEMKVGGVVDAYNGSSAKGTVSEYARTAEADAVRAKTAAERERLIDKLARSGIGYSVDEYYDAVIGGFSVTVKARDFSALGKVLGNDARLIVGEVYKPAATTEVITNKVDVYETGIFNSENCRYQGDGVVVAILDTGLDYTHTAFQVSNFSTEREKYTLDSANGTIKVNPSNDPSDIYSIDVGKTAAARFTAGLSAADVYMNEKVPYAYDYADKDSDVLPINSEHGTHVAGIIAGKDDTITGVAPNAQLAIMKVFSDNLQGAKTSWLLAALEDCVNLGVDVINMSLGSGCGFAREVDKQNVNAVYDNIKKAGISLIASAANSYNSTFSSKKNGTNPLTTNPDSGTVGSPSTYDAALSIASVEGVMTPYIKYGDQIIYFKEASTSSAKNKNFFEDLLSQEGVDGKEYDYVTIPGIGRASDYPEADEYYHGKIVLVKRGTTTFEEKVRIALMEKGAAGVIIYNNISGDISMQVGADIGAVCSISQDDGELLAKQGTGKITISRANKAGPFMSDFSSWGPTSDLRIKPEITGHGGEILSAVPGQTYDRLSGTSMAAPNVTGATALIRQYVTYSGVFGNPTPQEITAYVNRLMMSTADIIKNKNGLPAAVRKQGAGLVNINNAVTTSAYFTTYDKNGSAMDKSKIEYGDDKQKKGVYRFTFDVNNVTDKTVSYDVSSVITTEGISTTYTGHDDQTVTQEEYLLGGTKTEIVSVTGGGTLSGSTVSVNAHSAAKVTMELTLSSEDKKYLDDYFKNGMYVEGFIKFAKGSGATVDMNLPFLAFYGDWNRAPIFDEEYYDTHKDEINSGLDEVDKLMADAYATRVIGGTRSDYITVLGEYLFVQNPSATQVAADRNKIAISNYLSGVNSSVTRIRSINAGLLRNVKEWILTVTDDATGEIVYTNEDDIKHRYNQRKSFSSGGNVIPSGMEVDYATLEHNLKNNTRYTVRVKAYIDYGDYAEDGYSLSAETKAIQDAVNLRNVFEFPLYVDFEAPIVTGVNYRTEYDRTTKKTSYFADISVYDNHYAMGLMIGRTTKSTKPGYLFTSEGFGKYVTPVYSSYNSTSVVTVELTDYIDLIKKSSGLKFYEDGTYEVVDNNNSFTVNVYDYAMNEATYEIRLPDEIMGLAFTEDELKLSPNETRNVSEIIRMYPENGWLGMLEYETSDATVAEVKNGILLAKSSGTATITAVGKDSAGNRVEANVTVKVASPDDDWYNGRYSKPEVSKFQITGYQTIKAYYSPVSSEREIGQSHDTKDDSQDDDIRDFGGVYTLSMFPSEMVMIRHLLVEYYTGSEVTYSVGNSKIATISSDGVLKALAKGTTTVSVNVRSEGKTVASGRISLTVKDPYNTMSIYLNSYKGMGGFVDVPKDKGVTIVNDYAFSLYKYVDKDLANGDVIDDEDPYYIKPAAIGDGNYEDGWEKITKIRLPEGVTTINQYAFAKLTALEEVILPKSLTTIGLGAFSGCKNLKTINLENVKFINKWAFSGCEKLENVDLSGVVAIGNYSFENCKLSGIVLPKTSQSLGEGAFAGNKFLTSATFEASKIKIGPKVFDGCTALTDMDINAAVISAYAFRGCSSLKNVRLGKDVSVIGEYAFAGTDVEKFTLASGANLHLGEGGALVYRGADTANNEELVTVAPAYEGKTVDGEYKVVVTDAKYISNGAFAGNTSIYGVKANSAEDVGDYAFAGCTGLVNVWLDSVSTIGIYAFENTAITVTPNLSGLARIDDYAFSRTDITSVVIPDNAVIGAYAFANCEHLASVTIGKNVRIGDHAFYAALDEARIKEDNLSDYDAYTYTVKDENGDDTSIEYTYYRYNIENVSKSVLASLAIGENADIGAYAFAGNVRLNSLTLSGGATVGDYAFYNDKSLAFSAGTDLSQALSIGARAFSGDKMADNRIINSTERTTAVEVVSKDGETVEGDKIYTSFAPKFATAGLSSAKEIGSYAFADNDGLTALTLSDELAEISDYAFTGCVKLTAVTLPESVVRVGAAAFMNTAITEIDLEKVVETGSYAFALTDVEKVKFGEGAIVYPYAFYGCEKLATADGLEKVSQIGERAFAFTALASADLKECEYIGDFAFGLSDITSVSFGEKLVALGNNPFFGCSIKSFGRNEDIEFNGNVIGQKLNETYDVSDTVKVIDGVLYQAVRKGYELVSYPMMKEDADYVVEDGTVRISAMAFAGSPVVNATIAHTVKAIGDKAFYACANLKTVTFKSYAAPVLEEEFDESYASLPTSLPVPGYFYGFKGLGISKFTMWNVYGRTTNVYYGANFVDRIGHTDKTLVMVRPSNGQNYDSFIFSQYFGTVIQGSLAATDQTLEVIALINSLPSEITLQDEARVKAIREAYDKITSYEQRSLVTNYTVLSNAESTIEYLKQRENPEDPTDPVVPEKEKSKFGAFLKGNLFGFAVAALVAGGFIAYIIFSAKKSAKNETTATDEESAADSEESAEETAEENGAAEESAKDAPEAESAEQSGSTGKTEE